MKNYSIAIDGPAGAGKSTIAKQIAKELDFIYVDTGAMYRAFGLYCINRELEDIDECINLVNDAQIDLKFIDGDQRILLNNIDVTQKIRAEEIGNMASRISTEKIVRDSLVDKQRDIAKVNSVVMDGRDIGSNVLKDATLKIYLTASEDIRARRRWAELREKGISKEFVVVKEEIIKRDYQDMNREYAPLVQTNDAILVDSTDYTIEEVKDEIIKIFKEQISKSA